MGENRRIYMFWWETLKYRDHQEGLEIDERIILKLILEKLDGVWTEFIRRRIGKSGGLWRTR
jgi:hypothetical protein